MVRGGREGGVRQCRQGGPCSFMKAVTKCPHRPVKNAKFSSLPSSPQMFEVKLLLLPSASSLKEDNVGILGRERKGEESVLP